MVRKAHMNVEHTKSTSRRALLAASGTATIAAFAGCVGGDDDSDDTAAENGNEDGGTDTATNGDDTEQPVFVLVEGVGGGGHDHGGESGDKHDHEGESEHDHGGESGDKHDHEGDGEHDHGGESGDKHDHEGDGGHSYMQKGLTSSELDHACGHMEEIDEFGASSVEGATSADAPSYLEEVHVPYEVEFEGDSAYVAFKMGGDSNDQHDHEGNGGHESGDSHDHEGNGGHESGDSHDHEGNGDHESGDSHDHEGDGGHESGDSHDHEGDGDHESGDTHDHGSGQMLAFFTRGGSSSVVEGELVYDEGDESQCAPMDRYVVVQPTNGEAVVELTPE